MRDVYIVAAARTPIGKFGGGLKDFSPVELGAHAMRAALERAGLDGGELDLYIMGQVLRAGHGQLTPRQAALRAGVPLHVDGCAVDMVCSSGMMALLNGAMAIRAGDAELVLAGGMESMSQAAFVLPHQARWGYKLLMGEPAGLYDSLARDGLTDPLDGSAMGAEAERLAAEHGVSRAEMDEVAYESHRRAASATQQGCFGDEIAPVCVQTKQGPAEIAADEGIRDDTTAAGLARLRPAFAADGVLTAGNSSQISDGAAALVLASERAVGERGLRPLARLVGGAWAAGESWRFVEAPVPAVQKLLAKTGLAVEEFDLVENNEAFALNSVLFHRMLGIPYEKLNVWGGAIALGHPIGCSGARLVVTLVNALRATGGRRGLAALCHGLGGGTALAVERVE